MAGEHLDLLGPEEDKTAGGRARIAAPGDRPEEAYGFGLQDLYAQRLGT